MAFLLQSPQFASNISGIGRNPIPIRLCSKPLSAGFGNSAGERSILGKTCCARIRREFAAPRIRDCANARECGVWASASGRDLRDPCHLSAPTPPTTSWTPVKGGDDKPNCYVNAGHAIRTLRDEFPAIFYREPSFDIYREDIAFMDPSNSFVGIDNYKLIFWALRFNGRLFFKALWVDIISVWQPVESTVMIRWAVHGIPRVPWETQGRFDGVSEYKLDRNGKIFEHRVDNIATNSPPKFRVVTSVGELIQALGLSVRPQRDLLISRRDRRCLR
ncbi:hypothetical protein H6P81_014548 [Aristolochia fimbriata]|uniref:Uncharacterized protein n=1 Tax=Aristolochia fimbriata TaxID=158543 RepID=A0AAV7EJY2_ARIFI|nr:hypothetical protein H6P81_014548 [Aristolochia fimbriata]